MEGYIMPETVTLKLVKEIPAAEEAAETIVESENTSEEPAKQTEAAVKSTDASEEPAKQAEAAVKFADESKEPAKQAEAEVKSTDASEDAAGESEIPWKTRRVREVSDSGFARPEPEDYFDEEPQSYADFLEEEEQKKKSFRFRKKDVEASRDKWILSRISDEDLMEYIRLEQKRSEQTQKAKEIRDRRIITTVQLAISLAAIVAVIYFLKDNPVILTNILYIVGIVAVILFWKGPHKK